MKRYTYILAILFAFILMGCSGGTTSSGSTSNLTLTTISGVAIDEPISNGTVVIKDLNDVELKTTNTDLNGSFSLEVDSSKITDGYMLSVSGGKIGNNDFNGTLNAVYTGSHDKTKANITLITSLIQKLSEDEIGTELEKRDKAIKRLVDIGMIQNEDWFEENPKNLELPLLQNEVKSRGLTNWLNDMKNDLADNELSINSHQIFPKSHGGINRIFISPIDSVSLFAGQTSKLYVSSTFLDNNKSNIIVTKISGPSWATVDGTTLNIAPPETETNFTTYTLLIEVFANGTKTGRKKDITISLLKSVVLVTGEVGTAGGRIENEWKDISISVNENQLDKNYIISLIAGINNKGEVIKFYNTKPEMSDENFDKLNIYVPSMDILKNAYLLNNDEINRSLKNRAVNGGLNSCIEDWIDWNGDNFKFDKLWAFSEAEFIKTFSTNGYPRKTVKKEIRASTISKCAWTLRSSEYKFEFDENNIKYNANEMAGKTPVLFIHGFARTGNLGGFDGEEYFGQFPRLSKELGFIPFEFDWRTNANFREVADDLGKAISLITEKTGKKIHVVAHSFGGILTRTLLQGMTLSNSDIYTKDWAEKNILSVTTVGTPHQGIMDEDTVLNFGDGDITIPEGRHGLFSGEMIEGCMAVTCDQLGENWFDLTSKGREYVGLERPSEFLYKLTNSLSDYPNIKTQVLIGLLADNFYCKQTEENKDECKMYYKLNDHTGKGDDVIHLASQRIAPDLGIGKDTIQNNPQTNFSVNTNIEEYLLGFEAVKYPDFTIGFHDNIFSLLNDSDDLISDDSYRISALSNSFEKEWVEGYVHTTGGYKASSKFAITKDGFNKKFYAKRMSEVGIQNCDDMTKVNIDECRHSTWNYFRKFVEVADEEVESKEKIFVSGKVLQDGEIPVKDYIVKVYVNNEFLDEQIISGTSDYNISVEFRAKTGNTKYEYHIEVTPDINSKLRANPSNKIETDTTIKESDLTFNDILLVDTEYKTSEISITLKDAIDDIILSDYNITIYNGDNPIIKAHTDNASYSTILGLGDYTCVATKTGYKKSPPIPCYSKKDEVSSYEINIYRDEAVGTARRIVVLADDITPWDTNSFTTIMSENGYTEGESNGQYYVVSSDKIATTEKMIPGKDLIIVMNDQAQIFYDRLATSMDKIDTFVKNGGVVLFEVSDRGWNEGQMDTAGITALPGGVTFNYNYDRTNINVNGSSTLMTGIGAIVEGNYASHESFDNLPIGTTVYTTDSNGKATLIEYKYGLGWIIATGQPLEYGFENDLTMGEIYPKLYNYILGNISNDQNKNISRSLRRDTIVIPSHK